jgi:peptide/nickel transport system substrate-binding protein
MMSDNYWQKQAIRRRRVSRRVFLGGVGAAATAVAMGACGGEGEEAGPGGTPRPGESPTAAAGQPKRGGTLVSVASSSGLHYDQHQHPGIVNDGRIYNGLLKLGTQLKILNDLAVEWETPEPNVYIFHLRQGVKFQNRPPVNGREATAEDVVYTIERSRTDDPAFTNRWMWSELTSVEATDTYTVKATFTRPFGPALYHFAASTMGVIAREVVARFGDLKTWESRIGTGPFMMEEVRRDDITRLKRNPDYFDPNLPYLDGIDVPIMPDRSTRIVAFRGRQIDLIPIQRGLADMQEPSRGMDDVTVLLRPDDNFGALGFNHSLQTLSDERVRRAISLAIDQQDLIRAAGGEDAGVLIGMSHPHGPPFALTQAELQELTKPDLAEAKSLISAAGYESGFDLGVTVASTEPIVLDVAALMKQQLAEININLTLDTQEMATFIRKLFDKTFETILVHVWTPALDPGQNFHGSLRTGSAQNYWHSSIPELDALDDQHVQETDLEKRAELTQELERLNFKKVIALPLFAMNGWIALRNYVKDYDYLQSTNAGGWQYSEVWLDK